VPDVAAPLNFLSGYGDRADPVVALTWGVLLVSVAVILIIALLLGAAIGRRPGLAAQPPGTRLALESAAGDQRWIWIGVGVSAFVLLLSVLWTMQVLATVAAPAVPAALTIEITGHQWWWEVRYLSNEPMRNFVTANEIRIPAGRPVRFRLIGADVIHSFWVPALFGKTDLIPGQINTTWLEAHRPGLYLGQCTEYCGVEHAHMGFSVIALPQQDFAAWWDQQLRSPAEPDGAPAAAGKIAFTTHCGSCHALRGTDAAGILGPDLSHLMTRRTLAAGTLPNDAANLERFIANPQAAKPGSMMPRPDISAAELTDIRAYLITLN
jgi:cytochrome c oxidase subunit 2